MRRRYIWDEKTHAMVEILPEKKPKVHNVQPDFEPYRSNDGAIIGGRAQFREHLARTDTVEMGHSDIRSMQENWNKRKSAHREKISSQREFVQEHSREIPITDTRSMSHLSRELANRLDGRPAPERKELIKLGMEVQRMMRR